MIPSYAQTVAVERSHCTYLHFVKALCPKVGEAEWNYLERGLTVVERNARDFFIHASSVQ